MLQSTEPVLVAPMINLNGTSRADLIAAYCAALVDLQRAQDTLGKTCPHGRDYPSTDILRMAQAEHRARVQAIASVIADLTSLAERIA